MVLFINRIASVASHLALGDEARTAGLDARNERARPPFGTAGSPRSKNCLGSRTGIIHVAEMVPAIKPDTIILA